METQLFDRETILDLVVNFIPLGIILFFVAMFTVVSPWGFDIRASGIMLALMLVPFLALLVLTYLSAVAIAGDEKRATVYAQGQAGLRGATPLHEQEEAAEDDEDATTDEPDAEATPDADDESDAGDDADEEANDEAAGDDDTADDEATEETDEDAGDTDDTAADEAADDDTKPDEN